MRDAAGFPLFFARAMSAVLLFLLPSATPVTAQTGAPAAGEVSALKQVPFEQLFNIEITSVSKRSERLVDAPSAIQIITAEEIRRSGATSLPQALRLATNLQVAQINSYNWAISARGFNAGTADKLLVLIDGRTVYTPLFSGVFWDVQHVMLEDIERIEVISGPGAALWGSNAVNGVINVITKSARDTQGALLSGGGGSFLRAFGNGRYGGQVGDDFSYRVYGMGFNQGETFLANGSKANDHWHLGQGGFRADLSPIKGANVTVQGDFYAGGEEIGRPRDLTMDGQNLLGRWTQTLANNQEISLQLYWDRTYRRNPDIFSEALNTFDIEFQHRFTASQSHKFLWGGGYRLMDDHVVNGPLPNFAFLPGHRTLQLISGFLQDEITLLPKTLFLTLGAKIEHNSFTGTEVQPNARIAWMPATNHTLWAAVSRAVRSPSRIDTELFVPGTPPFFLRGGGNKFKSETVIAYEAGYRAELTHQVTGSVSTFFNDYDDIRSAEPITGAPGQFIILNGLRAKTYGVELAMSWQATDWWRLRGGYTYLKKRILFGNSQDLNQGRGEGNDPQNQFLIQSMINLPANLEFDSILRYVDNLNQLGPLVPSYTSLDLRLGWRPTPNWEFAIVGQNLLEKRHPEFGAPAVRQEIPRSIYGAVTWKFLTGSNDAKSGK